MALPIPHSALPTLPTLYLYGLGNLNPLSDGHVTGVEEWLALQHRVDDPLVRTGRAAGGRTCLPFCLSPDLKPHFQLGCGAGCGILGGAEVWAGLRHPGRGCGTWGRGCGILGWVCVCVEGAVPGRGSVW